MYECVCVVCTCVYMCVCVCVFVCTYRCSIYSWLSFITNIATITLSVKQQFKTVFREIKKARGRERERERKHFTSVPESPLFPGIPLGPVSPYKQKTPRNSCGWSHKSTHAHSRSILRYPVDQDHRPTPWIPVWVWFEWIHRLCLLKTTKLAFSPWSPGGPSIPFLPGSPWQWT